MTTIRCAVSGLLLACVGALAEGAAAPAAHAREPAGRSIGYVFTDLFWAVHQSDDGREECPRGFNDGPREQFAARYPDATQRDVVSTQLAQEIATWHPDTRPDGFEFLEVEGELSRGLDLDGVVSADDFRHPDGTRGIDNQVYRAVGCIIGFRGPDGVEFIFQSKAIADEAYNRMLIHLTGVDSLLDDDRVEVTLARGRDPLLTDATGERIIPGGTQRIDRRWGDSLIRRTHGRISNGVLVTEPIAELVIPWMNLSVPTVQIIRDARFVLDLGSDRASGVLAGYADVDTWYFQLIRNDSTHHLSNGQISGISLYRALRRLADAYPDPQSGAHTAISTALDVQMTRVHVIDASP